MRVVLEAKLSDADAALYDAFVENANGGHFSQTRAWSSLAVAGRHLKATYFLAVNGGEPIAAGRVLRPALGIFKGPAAWMERGPVCRTPETLRVVLPLLRRALQTHAVARLTVMPYFERAEKDAAEKILAGAGFRNVQTPSGAHVRTLRLNLREKSVDELLGGGEREALRRKLKQAEKAGVRARLGNEGDVASLASLHSEMMGAQGKPKKAPAYFSALRALLTSTESAALFIAEHETKPIAAVLVMAHGSLVTYVIGATTTATLPFSKMASAMTAALFWAHARGASAFDFGGIPVRDDPDRKRASIAQFKFDFTKNAVDLTAEHARWF